MVDPVWIAAFGTLISAVTLSLAIYFRWRDSQSRMEIDYYVGIVRRATGWTRPGYHARHRRTR